MTTGNRWDDYFSKRLRREREARSLSQGALAELLEDQGVSIHSSAIAKIETNTRSVKLDEAAAVAEVFGLSLDTLLGRGGLHDERSHVLTALERDARTALDMTHDLSERLRASCEAARETMQIETGTQFQDAADVVSDRLAELHEALGILHSVTTGISARSTSIVARLNGSD